MAPRPSARWLDERAQIAGVDPGEAQLFAATADHGLLLLSGDKRAVNALAGHMAIVEALAGRIVLVDAIVIELCETLGTNHVRANNPNRRQSVIRARRAQVRKQQV